VKRFRVLLLLLLLLPIGAVAQDTYLPPTSTAPPSANAAEPTAPPPLVINGKLDRDLTPDERRDFLQGKVRTINQDDGQVEIVHVAPGYPVSIRFSEPVIDMTIGDKKLVSVTRRGRVLVFTALAPSGDTPVQVFFPGEKIRIYHVFTSDNFADGDSSITVSPFGPDVHAVDYKDESRRDLRDFIRILGNYDALRQEGALDPRAISRSNIFRESKSTGFTLFYLYRIHGAVALTFAYKNLFPERVRFDESRLRISLGNSYFLPDYVSLHDMELAPGAVTTGLAIVFNPTFDPAQPLEIIWK
jgi:hypothetical protein